MLEIVVAYIAASQDIQAARREVTCRQIVRVDSATISMEDIPYAFQDAIEDDRCNWERDAASAWEAADIQSFDGGTQYRFTILPSFRRPRSFVFSVDQQGNAGIITAIFLEETSTRIGMRGLREQPNFLILQRNLPVEAVQELLVLSQNTTICGATREPDYGYDGEDWNFEVIGPERRCYAHFWSPQDGPNAQFGRRLMDMGDDMLYQYLENENE